jgi:hypothetical protein
MSALDKVFYIGKVLQAGEALKDKATWKLRQRTLTNVLIILGAVPMFTKMDISSEDTNAIAYGITVFMGVLNNYFTTATTDTIGITGVAKK